jgi:tRNA(Ile)-lysidine synthase
MAPRSLPACATGWRRAAPTPSASEAGGLSPDPVARFAAAVAALWPAGAGGPLALAVSGGADSMAMLELARAALPGRVIAATVDHRLRAAAAEEAAMVAAHCAAAGVPHATLTVAEPPAGASLQARARDARYALLVGWARQAGAAALATAHQADDQAETFLMRAMRGAGLSGLAGIRRAQAMDGLPVIRPLLDWRRAELRATVRRAGVPFVDDPANADPRFDRTRVRRLLEDNAWLDPPMLARAALQLAEVDGDLRAAFAGLVAARDRPAAPGEVRIDAADLPRELRRRLARDAIRRVRAAAGLTAPAFGEAADVEPLLDALERGGSATQGGVLASARGTGWRFRVAPPRRG